MLIERIEVSGKGLPTAKIDFSPGTTIISGASDTGKTFLFECLEFMLGSDDSPKSFPKSENYERIVLTLKNGDKEIILERALRGGDYFITEAGEQRGISRKELNDYLLFAIGLDKKRLKKNAKNETVALSFSYLRKYFFIDEVSIVEQGSPVVSDDRMMMTQDKSLFRVILTGKDDSDLIVIEDKKIVSARRTGATKTTAAIIEKLKGKSSSLSDKEIEEQLDRCNKRIAFLSGEAQKIGQKSVKLLREKQELFTKIDEINNQGKEVTETLFRFNLLNDAYRKDFSRLNFIGEGKHLLSQLPSGSCPHCGRTMDHVHEDGQVLDAFDSTMLSALDVEKSKILRLQKDLLKTIEDLQNEREKLRKNRLDVTAKIENIDRELAIGLERSNKESIQTELASVISERDDFMQMKLVHQHVSDIESISAELTADEEPKAPEMKDNFGEDSSLFLLEGEIEKILEVWTKKKPKVKFDSEVYDIVIDGRARRSFGKGFRSIYRTAFHQGLMNLCIQKSLPHPKFLVIDSPLTTHEEADDQIDEGIQKSFFEYFAEYKSGQVIILENKEPPANVQMKVKYLRFSGIDGAADQGFFPIPTQA